MSGRFSIPMADALGRIVREQFHPAFAGGDGDELVHVEIKPMADGSQSWGIFVSVVDAAGDEHTFRTVVERDGTFESQELN